MIQRLRHSRTALVAGLYVVFVLSIVMAFPPRAAPTPLEPRGLVVRPDGRDVSRLTPVMVTFPTEPDGSRPDALLRLDPPAKGTYAWMTPRTLLFQPDHPGLQRGATYAIHLPSGPATGLREDVRRTFTVGGELEVRQVIPGDGDAEVPTNAQILVQFSRSVAPLTTLAEQRRDPVVRFDPPLEGTGSWLNTSIYRFVPTALEPSTAYRLTIPKGLSSAADGVLREDFSWSFRTALPHVASITPADNTLFASPSQVVRVTFDQPMDPSAAEGIVVRDPGGSEVAGTVRWDPTFTSATFTPRAAFALDTVHIISVERGLRSAKGTQTAALRTSSFRTAALPRVTETVPPDGHTTAGRFGVSIRFNNPMDPESLAGKLRISGFSAADLEGRVRVDEGSAPGPGCPGCAPRGGGIHASVSLRPSTGYTVELLPGARDRHGHEVGPHTFSFSTGEMPSTVSLILPGHSMGKTYSASAEPRLWFQATNTTSVEHTLWPLESDLGSRIVHGVPMNLHEFQPSGAPLRRWSETIEAGRNETVLRSTSLSGGGPLPTGYYFLRTSGQMRSQFGFAVVDTVLATKLSHDELLVWALDHETGAPVARVPVKAFGGNVSPAEAVTDENGLASFRVPTPYPGRQQGDRSVWVTIDDGRRFGVASTRWVAGTLPWSFGLPTEHFAREWVGHLYTDRPLYRPGETVNYKAVVRRDDDAAYSLPPADLAAEVLMFNPRGQRIATEPLRLSGLGTHGGSFQVPADAPLGDYRIAVQIGGHQLVGSSYRVAEFRKPEYNVEVATQRPSYLDGERIEVETTASFYFGGAVADAPVAWSAIASPHVLRLKGYERYSFVDRDVARTTAQRDTTRASGTTRTDAAGRASFSLAATLIGAEGPQQLTIAATVSDVSGQAVAASTPVVVHPGALYVGLRPAQHVASVGKGAGIEVVTVDTGGRATPARARVLVYDRQWVSTRDETPGGGRRFTSTARDRLLQTFDVPTGPDGQASVLYTPTGPGTLRIVAEVTDSGGRTARSATYLWVAGEGFASWQVRNDDTIQLVADRDRYEVGDTAEILVPAPFTGATALITVERGKVMTRTVQTLAGNSERLRIPITDRSVPNVFVSVVLYRGPILGDDVPKYKVGYFQLPVSTATRALTVSATPDRAQAKPGDKVRYDISVKDHTGRGVRAEVSAAVVDKALIALEEERGPDGLRAFWFERGLAVSTASSMAVSMDRANDLATEIARQGKGGAGFTGERPRQDFKNVAHWSAQLLTGEDGRAQVEVVMPDDLTTWRMQVRAVSGDTRVGEGTNELVSTKPLLLRPALPRFLRVGDSAEIRALVTNSTATASTVEVRLAAEGIAVPREARRATIAPGATHAFTWPATVENEGTATLAFSASGSGGLTDSATLRLPVHLDVTPETTATGGIVTDRSGVEAIWLPPFAKLKPGSLTIDVRSTLVGTLTKELEDLQPLVSEGTERIASRAIATMAVRRAERSATGASDRHDSRIASDIAAILGRQRPDGGWPWCNDPLCQSSTLVTAWALLALGEARRDGMAIDLAVVNRASTFVLQYVQRPTDVASPADPSDKAFMLAALAAAGGGVALPAARALYEQQRAQLTSWGRAYLLLALADGGAPADDPVIRGLLSDLAAAAIPSANGTQWEDPRVRSWFTSSTSTTGLVTLALARLRPDHALLPQAVRWLVIARGANHWQTSIDRAMAILGLATFAVRTGELAGDYELAVTLGGRPLLSGAARPGGPALAMTKALPLTTLTPGQFNVLAFSREGRRPGRLYYALDLRYVTPAQGIEAVNRGFAVSREYTSLADPATPLTSVRLGETVRVKLTVMAPADRSYVTVEDLLPAGLEAVDARLRTVDPRLRAQLEADRRRVAERAGGVAVAPWYHWYFSPWQHVELRDDRAVLYAQNLRKGVYEYVYYARATTPGDFFVAPAHAAEQYFPDVFGRSDSSRFRVTN